MDAYAYMLEQLRADDFARLRAFKPDGGARFSTWLVVVLRRLAVDHLRQRMGRATAAATETAERRRRLASLVGSSLDMEALAVDPDEGPDATLQRSELAAGLDAALSRLEPRDRMLLALRFEENLPASRIARLMGFPTQFHVYRRLNAVVQGLRTEMALRGFDAAAP